MSEEKDLKEIIEKSVNDLWEKYSNEPFCEVGPLANDHIPPTGIIFIGINPSLSDSDKQLLKKEKPKSCQFYSLDPNSENNHKYFRKFKDIAERTNSNWGHLDLLYVRETNQGKVKSLLKTSKGVDFIYQQCMITKQVLDSLIDENEPRIFVVNNTMARELLGRYRKKNEAKGSEHWIGYDFVWDDDIGTYKYKGCPFFFSSMLTGQRALDLGSYDRLVWQINRTKKLMKLST